MCAFMKTMGNNKNNDNGEEEEEEEEEDDDDKLPSLLQRESALRRLSFISWNKLILLSECATVTVIMSVNMQMSRFY